MLVFLFENEKRILQRIDYTICSDDFLLEINRTFLHHDYYTDIITFDYSKNNSIIGEVYISLDRVTENSTNLSTRLGEEISRVIIHGALHLCGYKDKTKKQKEIMRKKEDFYLAHL